MALIDIKNEELMTALETIIQRDKNVKALDRNTVQRLRELASQYPAISKRVDTLLKLNRQTERHVIYQQVFNLIEKAAEVNLELNLCQLLINVTQDKLEQWGQDSIYGVDDFTLIECLQKFIDDHVTKHN